MYTKLLPFLLAFISLNAFPLTIVNDVFDGSKLCNNLSTTYEIPSELQGKYDYEVIIETTDTNTLFIKYHLTQNPEADTVRKITSDLNNYFPDMDLSANKISTWSVNYQLIIDGVTHKSTFDTGLPYKTCYEYKSECNKITVYRKSIRAVCSPSTYYPKHGINKYIDTIDFNFTDSTSYSPIVCQALGFKIHTDSLIAKNLPPSAYKIRAGSNVSIECVTTPCPPYYFDVALTDRVDLSDCPDLSWEQTGYKGSALCGNLNTTYKLPDTLTGSYAVETSVEQIDDELIINHYLFEDDSKEKVTKIDTDLSDLFSSSGWLDSINIKVIHTLNINLNLVATDSFMMNPYNTCYEIDYSCIELTVYRKSLRRVCPTKGVVTRKFIEVKNDVVMVDFIDSTYMGATCLAEGYTTHTDSIKVTESDGLNNIDYRVFLGTHIECALGACPTMWLYEPQIGNAYFSNCIISGFEDKQNEIQFLFPNPAQDYFSIEACEGNVMLTNQFGQQFTLKGNSRFSTSTLPRGMYIATFDINGKTIKEKVVIQ